MHFCAFLLHTLKYHEHSSRLSIVRRPYHPTYHSLTVTFQATAANNYKSQTIEGTHFVRFNYNDLQVTTLSY